MKRKSRPTIGPLEPWPQHYISQRAKGNGPQTEGPREALTASTTPRVEAKRSSEGADVSARIQSTIQYGSDDLANAVAGAVHLISAGTYIDTKEIIMTEAGLVSSAA